MWGNLPNGESSRLASAVQFTRNLFTRMFQENLRVSGLVRGSLQKAFSKALSEEVKTVFVPGPSVVIKSSIKPAAPSSFLSGHARLVVLFLGCISEFSKYKFLRLTPGDSDLVPLGWNLGISIFLKAS